MKRRNASRHLLATAFQISVLVCWLGGIGVSAEDQIHDDSSVLSASEILLKVYDETRGLRWDKHTNWLQNTDVCSWFGVTCYDTNASDQRRVGHIQKLDLSGNRLLGTVPGVVFELPYLETLDVRDNADVSISFDQIADAQYLKELAFSNTNVKSLNGIEGARQLEKLHMTSMGLTGTIPSQLFQLTNLLGLYANYNKFSGSISGEIGKLSYLKELYLFNSDLTGQIPTEMALLSNLEILTLAENAFSGTIPTELNRCTKLNTFAINRAEGLEKGPGIKGALPSFSQWKDIIDIRLQNQLLSGSIPSDFLSSASKQEVIKVELSGNQLSGAVPPSLMDMQRLNLLLANNLISSVPNELCNEIDGWMDGTVGNLGCDAFLCPPSTFASEGHAKPSEACQTCSGATYWGTTHCASLSTPTTTGHTEREVLVNLYNIMGGRYWKMDDGWLNPAQDICEWYGVECVEGKVTGLLLKNNDLSNSPPVELFSLPELKHLDFGSNAIDFQFLGIGNARKLETLLLSNCDLSSLDNIGELRSTSIRRLNLASNYLEGDLPNELFNIESLTELDISHNRFIGSLPPQVGSLTNLEILQFTKNKLTGQLPSNLGNLVALKELWASENEFSGSLPTDLSSLTRLETLSIHQTTSSKGIGGPLLALRNLGQLTSLQLDSNRLTGSLPADFLRNTEKGEREIEVRLSDNQLEGEIPSDWASRFQNLMLDISGNRISGIGNGICNQAEWNKGDVDQYSCDAIVCPPGKFNEFGRQSGQDTVCRDCSHSASVQYFGSKTCNDAENIAIEEGSEVNILKQFFDNTNGPNWKNSAGWMSSNNPCDGWYGIECNAQGKIVTIEMESNGLVGSPAPSVFELTSLRTLNLKDNNINFSFDGISQAANLAVLKLSGINLDSVEGISQASSSLTELHLTDNNLQGSLPGEILQLSSLRKLYLNYNGLEGKIPPEISALKNLEELFLFNNRFSGQLPGSLGLLTRLKFLSLAENSFSGTLPPELNDLTNLEVLSIQREGGTDDANVGIDQGNNDDLGAGIGGPLPAFENLKYLRKLYLGVNSLSGSIPYNFLDGIDNKALSIEVDLVSNRLTGMVPASLTQFDDLSIYVAGNQITDIADGLCRKDNWMNGAVSQFECDAILCPPGTFSELGRQTGASSGCTACDSETSSDFYGSFNCLGEEAKQTLSESAILEDLFRASEGDSWKLSQNWLDSDESICSWFGVTCVDGKESVESISLPGNGLRGSIPDEIYELPNLKQINLAQNSIDMRFGGIGRATRLEYLNLDATKIRSLAGIDSATNLKVLHVTTNKFDSLQFPNEVLALTNLESLDLSENPLASMPSLESLSGLKYLACSECAVSADLPVWLGSLTNLEHLQLDGNSFRSTIPNVFSSLTNLKFLSLANQVSFGGGGLEGVVPDFAGFGRLQELYLQRNSFDGNLPSTFLQDVSISETVTVDLRFNNITGSVPDSLTHISDLELFLASNKIDTVPSSVCSKSWNDKDGSIAGCDHILCDKGTFNALGRATPGLSCTPCDEPGYASYYGSTQCGPDFEKKLVYSIFENLGGLGWTHADGWQDHDDFCSWYGVTCHDGQFRGGFVKSIDLSDNNLNGVLDTSIWELVHMDELDLSKNNITISLEGIGNAQSLESLHLSETKMPSIEGIGAAPSLKYLHLTNCHVGGSLPEELYQMTQLEGLYLNYNQLTGTLSTQIGQLSLLKEFFLFHNSMTGFIPSQIGLLEQVEIISLGENKYTGPLPTELNSLQELRTLSLQRGAKADPNQFFSMVSDVGLTGNVISFSNAPKLRELYLSNNHLIGDLPPDFLSAIDDTSETILVDLSSNILDGAIPASLIRFQDLRLDLSENRLRDFPNQLCSKTEWFDGEMALGCDALLCPPGTYNEYGRRVGTETCQKCNFQGSTPFYGSRMCGALYPQAMSDKTMLRQVYTDAGGLSWENSENWLSEDVSVCQWYGVTCSNVNGEDRVVELDLSDNGMTGLVPSIVFYLPHLRKLDLGRNELFVKFDDIDYSSLEELYLDETVVASLEGISKAKGLRILHMHHVSLDGQVIPEEFYTLTNLTNVALSESGVTGTLSTNLGRMTNLVSLLLHGNDLSGSIPASINQLSQLEDLFLSGNYLHGTLPGELTGLTSLTGFFMENYNHRKGAGISGPLPSFSTMPKLRDLHLSSNSFTGSIPRNLLAGIDDLSAEVNIRLNSNHLTGALPSELTVFDKLNLDVTNNFITEIEDGLCSKSSWLGGDLGSFDCNGLLCPAGTYNKDGRQSSQDNPCAQCSGEDVPPYLGQTSCLSEERKKERAILELFYKSTGGSNWKNNAGWLQNDNYCQWYGISCADETATVESISLGSNNLAGSPPSTIFDLLDLKMLWLYSNPIDFSFEGIGNAVNLEKLRLDSTGLKSIDGIGSAPALVEVDVRFNQLEGELPDLQGLVYLESFSCSSNQLSGALPSFTSNRKMTSLRVASNAFTGTIPSFAAHPELRTLDLAANDLTGEIPRDLFGAVDSSAALFFDVSSNRITGTVPSSLSRFDDLTLYLRDNMIDDMHSDLCSQKEWNGGDVGLFQCDGILCPPQTFSPTGRASRGGSDCQRCDSARFFGATTCGADSGGASRVYGMSLVAALFSTILLARYL